MICGFRWAPSRNGEAGAETAIPGWKTKFELNKRKKISKKITSMSGNTTSQPKLYSLVRLSFIFARRYCQSCECSPRRIRPLADRSSDRDGLLADLSAFRVIA